MTADELEQLASLVADLVVERLRDGAAPRVELLDTRETAERLGVSVDFVRDHAASLGGVKLGSRLAFRWPDALDGLPLIEASRMSSGRSQEAEKPVVTGRVTRRRNSRRDSMPALLPITGVRPPL
jgi:hypothetical protein